MRLVDADKIKAKLKAMAGGYFFDRQEAKLNAIEQCMDILGTAKTVAAKPIVYARWENTEASFGGFGDTQMIITCSNCDKEYIFHGKHPNYCPNCGAKMNKDEVEHEIN